MAILLGLLSCVVNVDYKSASTSDDDVTVGYVPVDDNFLQRANDDDLVCFEEASLVRRGRRLSGRVRPSPSRYDDESAATMNPQEALLSRQNAIKNAFCRCLDVHEMTLRDALKMSRISSVDADEEMVHTLCGGDRCWCTDAQWPPTFWNELHIQRMISEW